MKIRVNHTFGHVSYRERESSSVIIHVPQYGIYHIHFPPHKYSSIPAQANMYTHIQSFQFPFRITFLRIWGSSRWNSKKQIKKHFYFAPVFQINSSSKPNALLCTPQSQQYLFRAQPENKPLKILETQ